MHFIITIFCILLSVWSAVANGTPPPPHAIGMLNIPRLISAPSKDEDGIEQCGGYPPEYMPGDGVPQLKDYMTPLSIYRSPSDPQIATQLVASWELQRIECSYEAYAAVVYDMQPGWYEIAYRRKTWWAPRRARWFYHCKDFLNNATCFVDSSPRWGWVRAEDVGRYFEFEKLPREFWRTTTDDWDGSLFSSPDFAAAKRQIFPKKRDDNPEIAVVAMKKIDGALWVKIKVFNKSFCVTDKQKVTHIGWIPLHNISTGDLTLWTYPRGC